MFSLNEQPGDGGHSQEQGQPYSASRVGPSNRAESAGPLNPPIIRGSLAYASIVVRGELTCFLLPIAFHHHGPLPDELGETRQFSPYEKEDVMLIVWQRNDAVDAYGTHPIAQRPYNGGGYVHAGPKVDAFADGVQRTQ